MKVWVVMERAAELPDSVWLTQERAEQRASELGAPDDAVALDLIAEDEDEQ